MDDPLASRELPVVQFGAFRLLIMMAAQAEYGENLKALFTPVMTGVGPVEAAVAVTAALADMAARAMLPDLVVCLGSAGSATLRQTEIYQVGSVSWRDMDARALGVKKGVTPFLGLPGVLPLPVFTDRLPVARLSTGANVVSKNAYQSLEADMVDMETYAVLRACQRFGVPLVGLRGISDGRADLRHMDDWKSCLPVIDKKLARAVMMLKSRLEQEKDLGFLITGYGGKHAAQAVDL